MIKQVIAACLASVISFSALSYDFQVQVSEHPTSREDGTALPLTEISHYVIRMETAGSSPVEISTVTPSGLAIFEGLVEDRPYSYSAATVDTDNQFSKFSAAKVYVVNIEDNLPFPPDEAVFIIKNCPTNKICKVIIEERSSLVTPTVVEDAQ